MATQDSAPVHDATVGAAPGEGDTHGGAAVYSIPIEAPPGRAGMQPQLSLDYSSRSGNGIAGMGWSLSGSSAIHRCPQTIEQDGKMRSVSFDGEDRLCLDGQRLVPVSGAYGISGTTYRTEIDSFARVTQLGTLTGTSSCFKVEQKSGRILHYGAPVSGASCSSSSRNARVQPTGATASLSWLLEKDEDRVGNNIFYTYTNVGYGEVLLSEIAYTGFESNAGDRHIVLGYQARPGSGNAVAGANDVSSNWLAQGVTLQTQRLATISTQVNAQPIKTYKLSYLDASTGKSVSRYSGRSHLHQVQECAYDGAQEICRDPTLFIWHDSNLLNKFEVLSPAGLPQFVPREVDIQYAPGGAFNPNAENLDQLLASPVGTTQSFRMIGDLDGDGAREAVAVVQDTETTTKHYLIQLLPNRTVRSAVEIDGFLNFNASEYVDLDGDGRAEMLNANGANLTVSLWNLARGQAPVPGVSPFRVATTSIPGGRETVSTADFNGDGRNDIAQVGAWPSCGSGKGLFIHLNTQNGSIGTSTSFTVAATPQVCLDSTGSGLSLFPEKVERVTDFDGDGFPDFVVTRSTALSTCSIDCSTLSRVILAKRAASMSSPLPSACAVVGALAFCNRTINEIGIPGSVFNWNFQNVARLMDINGDGLDDLVFATPNTSTPEWQVRLNKGGVLVGASGIVGGNPINTGSTAGLRANTSGNLYYANKIPQGDVDSDGRTDLLVPTSFALKVCGFFMAEPRPNGECPVADSLEPSPASIISSPNAAKCPTYQCPEDPQTGALNMPTATWNGRPGYIWDNYAVGAMYANGLGWNDHSSYKMDVLRFVQTGPYTVVVQQAPTEIVMSLRSVWNQSDDVYGDGLADWVTRVGCPDSNYVYIPWAGATPILFPACHVVNDGVHGPAQLPNNQGAAAPYRTQTHLFINANLGNGDGGTAPGMGALPPKIPEVMESAVNGLADRTIWRYAPLSIPYAQAGVPVYALPTGANAPYVDDRHYYFTSSMPVVTAMVHSAGKGSEGLGFRSWVYGYEEAMYNRKGRGFQGFRKIIRQQATGVDARALRVTTRYHQKFPLTSRVDWEETASYQHPAIPLKREANVWRCGLTNRNVLCPGDDNNGTVTPSAPLPNTIYAPYHDRQVTTTNDLAAAESGSAVTISTVSTHNAISSATTTPGWDAYGNLRNQIVSTTGGSFVGTHTVATTNVYVIDESAWWLDRLNETTAQTSISYQAGVNGHPLPAGASAPTRTLKTSYDWNTNRTLKSQTVQPGIPNQEVLTNYTYPGTNYGLPSGVMVTAAGANPASRSIGFTYTKDGISQAADGYFVLQTTNAAAHVTTTETRPRDGQVSRTIAPTNLKTITTYDAFGTATRIDYRTTTDTELEPSTFISLTRCDQSGGGGCPGGYGEGTGQTHAAYRTTIVKNGAPTQVTWSDKLGRPVKQATRGFGGSFVQTLTEYDAMGTVARESVPHFSNNNAPYWTTYDSYDRLNRVRQKTSPASDMDAINGNVRTLYTYSGAQTKVRVQGTAFSSTAACPANRPCMEMFRWHDTLGRLVRTQDALGGVTRYWYDGAGNPVAVEDAGGHRTLASYNDLGHRLNRTDPDAGYASFTYDALGQVLTQSDARGAATTNTYDVLGRLVQRTSKNPAGAGLTSESVRDTWQYDPFGGPGLLDLQKRERGSHIFSLIDVWQESYAYQPTTLRLSSQTTTIEGESAPWVTGYTYDPLGRERTVAYPSGLTVRKDYNYPGYPNSLKNDATGTAYWTANAQNAWGQVTDETFGNGMLGTHAGYASTGQYQRKRWLTSGSAAVDRLDYSYDSFGNLTQQVRNIQGVAAGSETYTYDALQRLTRSTRIGVLANPDSIDYGYSADGNLQFKTDASIAQPWAYEYGANGCGPHGLSGLIGVGSPSLTALYACDANGNRSEDPDTFYVYDAQNQMRGMVAKSVIGMAGGLTRFQMAPGGVRYLQVTDKLRLVYGPRGLEKETVSSGGGSTSRPGTGRASPPGTRWRHELGPVSIVRESGVDTVHTLLRDRIGSTTAVASASQALTATRQFDAFGKPREGNQQDRGSLDLAPATLRGFTEHEHLGNGLIHMNGRVYDPNVGRFLSVDPIIQFPTNSQSLNPYSYILNNPLAGRDPSGYVIRWPATGKTSCMGNKVCQALDDAEFLAGPRANLNLTYGGAPAGREPENGAEDQRKIRRGLLQAGDRVNSISSRESGSSLEVGSNCIARCSWESARTFPYIERERISPVFDLALQEEYEQHMIWLRYNTGLQPVPVEEWFPPLRAGTMLLGVGRAVVGSVGRTAVTSASRIGVTGQIGENALKSLGGQPQAYFPTSLGGRYVDQLVNGVAHEAKTGYMSLTPKIQTQIMKDVELMQSGQVQGAIWNFYRSPVTGKIGPSGPLGQALDSNGIPYFLHPTP